MLRYMLDTNICISVIKHRPAQVLPKFNENAAALCVSAITASELYFGVENSRYPARNRQVVEDFLSRLAVIPYDEAAAVHYGQIRAQLQRQGSVIGANDLHIAAHARCLGLVLVTNNTREFARVEGLRLEDWMEQAE